MSTAENARGGENRWKMRNSLFTHQILISENHHLAGKHDKEQN